MQPAPACARANVHVAKQKRQRVYDDTADAARRPLACTAVPKLLCVSAEHIAAATRTKAAPQDVALAQGARDWKPGSNSTETALR